MPWPTNRRIIGTKVQRLDGPAKATGRAKYSYDINRPGLLHAKILRCPHGHARVAGIDTSACEKTPGYRAFHMLAKPNEELFFAGAEVIGFVAFEKSTGKPVREQAGGPGAEHVEQGEGP